MQEKDNKNENIFSEKPMPALNERVRSLVDKYANGSVKRFSEIIKLSSSQKLNRIFNLDRRNNEYPEVSSDILLSIANKFPEINTVWLLTGKGNPIKEEDKREIDISDLTADDLSTKKIPLVDISVAAGTGTYNTDYMKEVENLSLPQSMIRSGRMYLCVRIKGNSMMPSILDGGYLIIYKLERQEWGDIRDNYVYVVCDMEGRSFVKRIKNRLKDHGFLVLQSDNPDKQNYPNFNLQEDEINTIWYAEWYFTAKIPNIQETFGSKLNDLENRFDDMEHQFHNLIKAINITNF